MSSAAPASGLSLPEFVTHQPEGAEAKYISALYALALHLDNELTSEETWMDKKLVRALDTYSKSTIVT